MTPLSHRPNLDHLKKQAKDLLALYRRGDAEACARLRRSLPAAAGRDDAGLAALALRLHDMQSCLAREHGFASWAELRHFVAARAAADAGRPAATLAWLRLAYGGHVAGGVDRARPELAARLLAASPGLLGDDPHLACAVGDVAVLRRALAADPGFANRVGGPLALPPLVAVTHSGLLRLPAWRERLHAAARLLLDAGADPNQSIGDRWPPASPQAPSTAHRLSALLGAAGENRDAALTEMLLRAGADPNDGESLYHALEAPDCTALLLAAGARVVGSNAIYRVLDLDSLPALRLLLAHGGDANEPAPGQPTADWGSPLLWAIRRRRSPAHIAALLAAGADPAARTPDGISAHLWALRFGLPEVAALLAPAGAAAPLPADERFVAACAAGDEAAARRIQAMRPDLPAALPATQLRLLPELAAEGAAAPVRLMVRLGWPIAVLGGDWRATALNHAVFRGDAALARFLLEHGASWREQHGFGDDVCGTLSWASVNEPVAGGDWVGCAEALREHGLPAAAPDPAGGDGVLIDGRRKWFAEAVTEVLLAPVSPAASP